MQKFRQFFITLRSSLWFLPGVMIAGSITLAFSLIEIDSNVKRDWLVEYPRIFGLGADGSRGMLTAIAGSMLTVAALTFSLTLSIIAQASGQYSPRILRNFMRDRINQFVLGYFVSVFAYCLIVLRTIRGAEEIKFVPSLGVLAGLILAIGGIIVLIYFIHHIAVSLQVTNIVDGIVDETTEIIEKIFPEQMGKAPDGSEKKSPEKTEVASDWYNIESMLDGYIQYVDTDGLMSVAVDNDLLIRMEYGIGQFVTKGTTLVSISKEPNRDWFEKINGKYTIYRYRTIEQDVGFGIRQIVDIALKALSPGINDTTTATICIDYLGVIVSRIANRKLPAATRIKDGEIRVFVKSPTFHEFVETAFDQIRVNGRANLAVFLRILKALSVIDQRTISEERRSIVKKHMELTETFAHETLQTEYEKDIFRDVFAKEMKKIKYERT